MSDKDDDKVKDGRRLIARAVAVLKACARERELSDADKMTVEGAYNALNAAADVIALTIVGAPMLEEDPDATLCDDCGRARTEEDFDYSLVQVVTGGPLGWFLTEDRTESLCGDCMARIMRRQ